MKSSTNFHNLFNTTKKSLANIPGFRTSRKIVVFESDDWGSLRMPSLSSFEKLESLGVDLRSMDAERYNLNDSLETSSDLENLFEVLSGVTDISGNKAVFTPVTIVANPDFGKIKQFDFTKYFYEPLTQTYLKYPESKLALSTWKQGISEKIFLPQMHGREHLNIPAWLNLLQTGEADTINAFNEQVWGFVPDMQKFNGIDLQAAFLLSEPNEMHDSKQVIIDGLNLFEDIFGYRASYFVPPNGHFNDSLNQTLVQHGIKFRNIGKIQPETLGNGKFRKTFNWLGKRDESGIIYITRNCSFEPSDPSKDWVSTCLKEISFAFSWKKPAIISTHRVNYTGKLNPENRDNGLSQLRDLLIKILQLWPDVEFMSSDQLGKFMLNN